MRIISDFHDYYDPICKHDSDRETLYLRKSVTITPFKDYLPLSYFNPDIHFRVLWFCGVSYKYCILSSWNCRAGTYVNTVCLTFEQADDWYHSWHLCRFTWSQWQRLKFTVKAKFITPKEALEAIT